MTPDNAIWWLKLKAKQKQKEVAPIFQGHHLPVTEITAEPIGKGKYFAEFDKQNPRQPYQETNEYIRRFQPEKVVQKQAWRDVERNRLRDNYAEDGSMIPDWDKVKAALNPKNWGVPDYSDKGSRGDAYAAARKAGEKEYMWNNQRFNTKYDGTSEQQLKETGITDEQIQNRSNLNKNLTENIYPYSYDNLEKRVWTAGVLGKKEENRKDMDKYPNSLEKERLDALNLYAGIPQKNNTFRVSNYKPSISKDNIIYYTFNEQDDNFVQNLIDYAYSNSKTSIDGTGENYDLGVKAIVPDQEKMIMGDYKMSTGKDDRGRYVSFYDVWDLNPIDFGKPFEIYDRIYTKDYGDGKQKRMYYSDKELSKLDVDKKNFDTLALQRELSNRGYKFPKSTKKDGTFDGVWGDETKNALLDYQIKNK